MTSLRNKLAYVAIACAHLATTASCSAPWAARPLPPATTQTPPTPPVTDAAPVTTASVPAEAAEPNMAAVVDKLQQVREIDPAAEQKLLEELRRTPAKSWPLVAEQFRASLAYHERLAAKELNKPREGGATTQAQVFDTGYDEPDNPPPQNQLAASDSRPSAPIGSLVDPRSAKSDGLSSEEVARSTPYSTPDVIAKSAQESLRTPRDFAAEENAIPIASATPTAQSAGEVTPARLETPAELSSKTPLTPTTDELDWQQHVEQAANDLSERVAESPSTTAEIHQHVSLRMLWLLAGDTEKALEPIPHISPGEQDYWKQQIFALATYLDHHTQPDDKRRAAAAVLRLDDAVTSLRQLGSLTLRNLSFCKNVYGYGSIEPFGADRFSPGQQVSLYVEVENYASRSTEKGYCTTLASTYELLDEEGERVSGGEFPDVDDCCQSRRRDFHIQYGLTLPEKLEPGHYQLELVVKDRQSDKLGHATASFEVRGARSGNSLTATKP